MKKVGAVDYYYFGTFNRASSTLNTLYLDLFAYNTSTKALVGQVARVKLEDTTNPLQSNFSGDIAFDAQGRMLILFGSSAILTSDSKIARLDTVPTTAGTSVVTATHLSNPNSTLNRPWAGMAYDKDGNLWLSRHGGAADPGNAIFAKVNPGTGALSGQETKTGFASIDLASCGAKVATMTLQKNIASRFSPSDQFALDIRQSSTTNNLATAQTSGGSTDLQPQGAGPVTVTAGVQYVIGETALGTGATLGNYTFTYTCTWSGGGTLGDGVLTYTAADGRAQATLPAIPTGKEGQNLNCVITNTAKPATQVPPKLVLRKNVLSRVNAGDQFNLRVNRTSTGVLLGEATTQTTPATGVQAPTVTTTIEAGQAYTISEGAAGAATSLSGYAANFTCTWNDQNTTEFARGVLSASATGRLQAMLPAIPTGMEGKTLTCTINNQKTPTAGKGLSCGVDTVYVLDRTSDNNVGYALRTTSANVSSGTSIPDRMSFGNATLTLNGLAINLDGSKAVSVRQTNEQYAMYVWDSATNSAQRQLLTPNTTPRPLTGDGFIGGTIDPASGDFYFGGWAGANFRLFRVKAAGLGWETTWTDAGTITVPGASTMASINGDIAFDANGNLYLLWSGRANNTTAGTHILARVDAAQVGSTVTAARIGTTLAEPPTYTANRQTYIGTYNGLAFSGNGELFASTTVLGGAAGDDYRSSIMRIDPSTGKQVSVVATNVKALYVDMAGCGLPPTMRLQKEIVGGRVAPNDQFRLDILVDDGDTSNTLVQSNTTAGSSAGIQAQNAGPVVVRVGSYYTIRESGAGSPAANLEKYTSGYSCQWSDEQEPWYAGQFSGTNRTFRIPKPIPAGKAGKQLVCTITNDGPLSPATIMAKKIVQDAKGQNPTPAAGWDMTATVTAQTQNEPTLSGPATKTTIASGLVPAPWEAKFTSSARSGTVTVSETRKDGFDFVEGKCTITPRFGDPRTVNVVGTATSPNPMATIPNLVAGDRVECEFVNREKPGWVTWEKVDVESKAALSGTEWLLTGPSLPNDGEVAVLDCVAADDAACPVGDYMDRDSRAGYFKVDGLVHGGYELVETKAPPGYVLDPTPHEFVVPVGNGFHIVATNARIPGEATWAKVDPGGTRLANSVWELTGPGAGGATVEIRDCVEPAPVDPEPGQPAPVVCAGYADKDWTAGGFKIVGLAWGDYSLRESKAPAGYYPIQNPIPFTVGPDSGATVKLVWPLGDQVNNPVQSPVLPLTGGLGRDAFFIAGLGIVALGLAAVGAGRLRDRRKGVAPSPR